MHTFYLKYLLCSIKTNPLSFCTKFTFLNVFSVIRSAITIVWWLANRYEQFYEKEAYFIYFVLVVARVRNKKEM